MSYNVLVNQMKCIIQSLDSGKEFMLKDIINDPPTRLGRTLFEAVEKGEIPNVRCIGKDGDVEIYIKL